MTPSFELLNNEQHRNLRIKTELVDTAHNRVNTALVTVGELSTLVHEYAIFISKSPSTEQFQLAAILGFNTAENLYLQDNKWQATYLPLDILRRPFQAYIPDANKVREGRIGLDVASEQVNKKTGEALFDKQGEATEYLKKVQKIFAELMAGTEQTRSILEQANQLKLIEPVTLNIDIPGQKSVVLNGLYGFNKEALTKLSGKELEKAHQSGVLQVSHLILSSTLHLQKLINWSQK
ncbi:SapC family protein [Paraglaciecola hydrolytica]|uniref:SapC protein n=1 Tax=Paraglaciecola hydrolytica TaxID=1799789 RepID=A0A136A0P8_9ALTE|nr:SapC family protein [Paraglaciecola hydrolytica]KXI28828.1 hypothetical protein AX660_11545 [Paraglaciecola hydrolytica]